MKTTIENINGADYTVVWHDVHPTDSHSFADSLIWVKLQMGWMASGTKHIATALPALPRHPKPEDAALLYRYMAEGIEVIYRWVRDPEMKSAWTPICASDGMEYLDGMHVTEATEFMRATDKDGNKIEVAINE